MPITLSATQLPPGLTMAALSVTPIVGTRFNERFGTPWLMVGDSASATVPWAPAGEATRVMITTHGVADNAYARELVDTSVELQS